MSSNTDEHFKSSKIIRIKTEQPCILIRHSHATTFSLQLHNQSSSGKADIKHPLQKIFPDS